MHYKLSNKQYTCSVTVVLNAPLYCICIPYASQWVRKSSVEESEAPCTVQLCVYFRLIVIWHSKQPPREPIPRHNHDERRQVLRVEHEILLLDELVQRTSHRRTSTACARQCRDLHVCYLVQPDHRYYLSIENSVTMYLVLRSRAPKLVRILVYVCSFDLSSPSIWVSS